MTEPRTLTSEQLVTELSERFGDDHMKWAFLCPNCGDVATGQDFRDALADHPRKHRVGDIPYSASAILGRECIGRTLGALACRRAEDWRGRGCDWAAYGFFPGPWTVTMPDGRSMSAFPIADAQVVVARG